MLHYPIERPSMLRSILFAALAVATSAFPTRAEDYEEGRNLHRVILAAEEQLLANLGKPEILTAKINELTDFAENTDIGDGLEECSEATVFLAITVESIMDSDKDRAQRAARTYDQTLAACERKIKVGTSSRPL